MRKRLLLAVVFCLMAGVTASSVYAKKSAQSAPPADKTAPSYDMKAQAIVDLQQLQGKFVTLAEAIPADKYSWRPAPGVRSVGELFLHVTAANHNIPTMMTGTTALRAQADAAAGRQHAHRYAAVAHGPGGGGRALGQPLLVAEDRQPRFLIQQDVAGR